MKKQAARLHGLPDGGRHIERTFAETGIDPSQKAPKRCFREIGIANKHHALAFVEPPVDCPKRFRNAEYQLFLDFQLGLLDVLDHGRRDLGKAKTYSSIDLIEQDLFLIGRLARASLGGDPNLEEFLDELQRHGQVMSSAKLVLQDAEHTDRRCRPSRQNGVENAE
ncbi:hypothetical protein [Thiocystis violacea]|uniref:hypothetical protein n=1 Tax=Thiocystis violacea TaxID=13725 RepID=UPI0019079994|nr:hypothetical protein [Thiocystis violacea]